MSKHKLSFYGGAGAVTGANFVLEGDKKIMVDCGLAQGCDVCDEKNRTPFAYNPKDIDILLVTHAHTDHIGRIPKLVKNGFSGRIISTNTTKEIVPLMFDDALSVMQYEKDRKDLEPIYTKDDVEKALSLWEGVEYHEALEYEGYSILFKDAGHILGSAIIEIQKDGKKIVFTGDLGNSPTPFLKDTEEITGANFMVMESVYGDRNHENVSGRTEKLRSVIESTIEKSGTLIIPAFSLERTQVLLYELNELIEGGELDSIPVFLDSPLAIKLTEVYRNNPHLYKKEVQEDISSGDDIFDFPKLMMTPTKEDSKEIFNVPGPKIIIAGSGMSHGGRVIFHEKAYLSDPDTTVLLVGFQVPGSLGRQLQDGAQSVTIFRDEIKVRATIEHIFGYSAHKDSDGLFAFVEDSKETLETVFVAMGETKASSFLAQRLRDYLDIHAVVPEEGQSFEIDF